MSRLAFGAVLLVVCTGMLGVSAETAPAIPIEIREASWHPDGDEGPPPPVLAFREEGKSPSVPGPLIRVAA